MIFIKLNILYKVLGIFLLFFIIALVIFFGYAYIPVFKSMGLSSLPQDFEQITAHSALYVTGYYDNVNVGAKNIKVTQIVLLDEANFINEVLVKEEGYTDLESFHKEMYRVKDYENELYFGIKSFGNYGISYTSIMYTRQRKEEYLKYVHQLRDYTIDELQ